jgi:hypothetical protein
MRYLVVLAIVGWAVEVSSAQSPYTWNSGTSGNFTDILRWNPNAPSPMFAGGEDFTIDAAGTYTVSLATNATVNNLTINAAGLTVDHQATRILTVQNTLTITTGNYALSGTIAGGAIAANGAGTLTFNSTGLITGSTVTASGLGQYVLLGGTFHNCTLGLNVLSNLAVSNRFVTLSGTTTLAASTSISLANQSRIVFDQDVTHGGTGNAFSATFADNNSYFEVRNGRTLTLGPASTLTITLPSHLNSASILTNSGTSTLINQGSITQTNGVFSIATTTFTNSGTVVAQGNGSITLGSASGTYTNAVGGVIRANGTELLLTNSTAHTNNGTLEVINNGVMQVRESTTFTNNGLIDLSTTTTSQRFQVMPNLTTSQLGNFRSNDAGGLSLGSLGPQMVLNNTSATLALNATTKSIMIGNGLIRGGTVTTTDGARVLATGTVGAFEGISFAGDLVVDDNSNGNIFFFRANAGTPTTFGGASTVTVVNRRNSPALTNGLFVDQTATLDNFTMTMDVGGTSAFPGLHIQNGNTLTLGTTAVVRSIRTIGSGGAAELRTSGSGTSYIVNNGTVESQNSSRFDVGANGTFTNNGTIQAKNTSTITLNGAGTLSNTSTGTIATIDAGTYIRFHPSLTGLTNAGIIRANAGGYFDVDSTGAVSNTVTGTIEALGSSGSTVQIANTGALTNAGLMRSTGTRLLDIRPGTTFANSGTLRADGTNNGILVRPGGAFTNSGTVQTQNAGEITFRVSSFSNLTGTLDASTGTGLISIGGDTAGGPGSLIVTRAQLGNWLSRTDPGLSIGNAGFGMTLDNVTGSPGTLNLNAATGSVLLNGGVIRGGTVAAAPSYALYLRNNLNNALEGVAFSGTIDYSIVSSSYLTISNNGATPTTFNAATSATLGSTRYFRINQTNTLDNLTITLSGLANSEVQVLNGNTTTIGATSTIRSTSSGGQFTSGGTGTNNIVNNGILEASGSSAVLLIDPNGTLTNNNIIRGISNGRVDINPAGGLVISPGSQLVANTGGQVRVLTTTTVNAGTITAAGGTTNINNGGTATLTTNGTVNATSTATVNVGNSAASTIGNSGSFTVDSGSIVNVGGTGANRGTLTNTGGTYSLNGTTNALTTVSGGTLTGAGTINGSVAQGLTITTGGTLAPGNSPGQITVGGGLDIGGTLELDISQGNNPNNSNTAGPVPTPGTGFDTIQVRPPAGSTTATNATIRTQATNLRVVTGNTASGIRPFANDTFWQTTQRWRIATTNDGNAGTTDGIIELRDANDILLGSTAPAFVSLRHIDDINGTPINFTAVYPFSTFAYEIVTNGTGQNLDLVWQPVPEPVCLLVLSAVGIGLWPRRKIIA